MRRDHRPLWLKRAQAVYHAWYVRHFVVPRVDAIGPRYYIVNPKYFEPTGPNIRIGNSVYAVAMPDNPIRLAVWRNSEHEGAHLTIGKNVLLSPGTRLTAGIGITVEDNVMFAANSYVTDADWHHIYARELPIGKAAPVVLKENCWIGDSATVLKGVTVGVNSIVAAGSVVTKDVPDNTIVAGNPARVVKELDPDMPMGTRANVFENPDFDFDQLARDLDKLELSSNSFWGWLRASLFPRPGD